MRFVEGTTRKTLNDEYLRFVANLEDGKPFFISRAYGDQRFGQYFWNEYGQASESWPELFYEEDVNKAYMLAFYELREE